MRASFVLRDGIARLTDAGIIGPERDARALMAHALGIRPDRLLMHLADDVSQEVADRFDAAIARRATREPVSHITGVRQFYGRDFTVSKDALDPRPETEILIVEALKAPFDRVLDLGTGTGCILLTLLAENKTATGLGVDASADALQVATQNANQLNLTDRAEFQKSDWFSNVTQQFDLIVSNPPYIAMSEMPDLSPEVQGYEPHMALTDFSDGLSAYRTICAQAGAYLAPKGRLLVEIGPTQAHDVHIYMKKAGFESIRCLTDFDGRDRVICAEMPENL